MASLNHIGIATQDLPRMKKLFQILGLPAGGTEEVAEQGVRVHFLDLPPEQGHVELLEPIDPQGTVAQFIQKKGPGIHHLSFLVDTGQLDAISRKLASEGFKLIYPSPKAGAHQMRINFLHPSTTGGILIEIMEKAGE